MFPCKIKVVWPYEFGGIVVYDSNSVLGNPDWRMMDRSVPVRNSAWFGTGMVIVVSGSRFCMTMWLPRWRTSEKPYFSRIAQTCFPERMRSLPNSNLHAGHVYFLVEACLDLFTGCGLKE
jgi:hypothetical protein